MTALQPRQEDQWFEVNNENGESEIEVVGPGIYQIQVIADNYAAQWSQDVNTLESLNAIIKLTTGGTIKGTIVDKQGNPINGAKVIPFSKAEGTYYDTENIFVSEEGATQSIDGQFILKDLAPGLESIKVTHPDYAYKIIKDIQVKAGQTTDSKPIIMDHGTTIEGYVYDNYGIPQPELVLLLKRKDLPYQSVLNMVQFGTTITDSNGFFSVHGVSGDQCIISRRDGIEGLGLIWRSVDLHDKDIVNIQFGGKPFLSGTLIVDGRALVNQRIVLSSIESEQSYEFYSATVTDLKGNFRFRGLIPGKYLISYELDKTWVVLAQVNVQKENEDTDIGVITYETRKK